MEIIIKKIVVPTNMNNIYKVYQTQNQKKMYYFKIVMSNMDEKKICVKRLDVYHLQILK